MDENMGTFIVMLVQTVIFIIPVLALVYKQGRKDQVMDEMKKDVDGIGKKVAEIRDSHTNALAELKNKIDNMDHTLVEAVTTIKHLSKSIEELKGGRAR
jgi:uncharacterized protein YoxC